MELSREHSPLFNTSKYPRTTRRTFLERILNSLLEGIKCEESIIILNGHHGN